MLCICSSTVCSSNGHLLAALLVVGDAAVAASDGGGGGGGVCLPGGEGGPDAPVEADKEGHVEHEEGEHAEDGGDHQADDGRVADLVLAHAPRAQLLLELKHDSYCYYYEYL